MSMLHSYTSIAHDDLISLAHEIAPTMLGASWYQVCQAAEQLQAELARYAESWDASADARACVAPPLWQSDDQPKLDVQEIRAARKAVYDATWVVCVLRQAKVAWVSKSIPDGLVDRSHWCLLVCSRAVLHVLLAYRCHC